MKKRLTALVLAVCLVFGMPLSVSASSTQEQSVSNERTTTDIKLGDYITLGSYNGEKILWRCVDIDENGALMLSDKILDTLAYDAKTNDNSKTKSHSRNYKRDTYGSNYWKDSNMRSWLNSTAGEGKVDWLCGNPPRDGYVGNGGDYEKKAGFLSSFSKSEIAAMKTVTQRSLVSHPEYKKGYIHGNANSDLNYYTNIAYVADNFYDAYYENTTEKMFLLDVKQLNAVYNNLGNYYIAANNDGVNWPYWLRTPVTDCNHDMRYVSADGTVGRYAPWYSHLGVRPAFYLDTDYYVTSTGDGSKSNPYEGSAPDKIEDDYTVSESASSDNVDWDIDTNQSIELNLGEWYSADGKYANPTIPVYTIQKPRSDTENMVIIFCGEGYTKNQQGKFINDVKQKWNGFLKSEPFCSMADRFNVYALCTASETGYDGGSTFFDMSFGSYGRDLVISNMNSVLKNHILDRCIGPEFIDKIHDAHIKNTTNPNEIPYTSDGKKDEYGPYRYVWNYINEFVLMVNSSLYGGASVSNLNYGIRYASFTSDNEYSVPTLVHELGHGLLYLTEEYNQGSLAEGNDREPNVAWTGDPDKVKWKKMLGFRTTYSTRNEYNQSNPDAMVGPSWQCVMRSNMNFDYFCEICKLHGVKVLSKRYKNSPELYVATPEVKKYTGDYKNPFEDSTAYEDTSFDGFWKYEIDRENRLLSGKSKNNFTVDMAGQQIELRTIVQNLTDEKASKVKMKMWIKHSDGSTAVTKSGEPVECSQTYDIPEWSKKSIFYPDFTTNYDGIDFDSGLVNCSMVYKIPDDAELKKGDTVAFEVTDENGNILADDNTETQPYANVNIEYKFKDGTDIPNTDSTEIPVPVGTTIDWKAPKEMYGYTFAGSNGIGKKVSADGLTVTYYYTDPTAHTHTWSDWTYNGDAEYTSASNYKNGTRTHTCTVCGESETEEAPNTALLRKRGNALALESNITLATYVGKDVVDYYDEVYAEFTRNGKTTKVYPSEKTLSANSTEYNIFDYKGISPQTLGDEISITVYGVKDGITYWGNTATYSATDYIKSTLASSSSSAKLKTLLVDLVYYGEACQMYQGYNTDKPLTDILTDEQKAYRSTGDLTLTNIKNSSYATCENRLVKLGTALRLSDSVELAIPLNMTGVTVNDLTMKVEVGNRTLSYSYAENPECFELGKDGYWYFYFDRIYANQLSDEVFITAYRGEEQVSYTLRYSAESYAATVKDEKLKAVTDAMMRYGNSAKAYKG